MRGGAHEEVIARFSDLTPRAAAGGLGRLEASAVAATRA